MGWGLAGISPTLPTLRQGATVPRPTEAVERCTHCGENFGYICADDLPPYLNIVVVRNIIAPFFMLTDRLYSLSG